MRESIPIRTLHQAIILLKFPFHSEGRQHTVSLKYPLNFALSDTVAIQLALMATAGSRANTLRRRLPPDEFLSR